ncbi:AraC family transcriptional regulator ligand-binding domain-containing protein [Neptunomonas qingdaonensis]|nr:AraC family transcriptional regulator ligand-binding domain-containing protein [Neptunomonas qingdaonensis]
MSVITASAKLLEPVFQLAQHYRMEPAMVLSCAQLSSEEFAKPGARFPAAYFSHVLQALVHASNNPRIALNLGEATQPRLLGSIGFIMSTAPTLDKAYQTLVDYFPLLFEGAVLQMEQTVEGTLLTIEMNQPDLQTIEYFLACLVNWPRWLTGQQVPVSFVHLTFPEPEDIQPYQRFFAAEVEFDAPSNQILLHSQYLTHSCLDANAEMHQLHREFADSLLSKSNQQSALVAQTRHLIRQQLNEGGGSVRRDQVAASVGLSLRTLQRKLGALGTSFQDIYDLTRREVSLQHIQRGQLSFGEIAFQLGFSNQSAFQKAFKRWMGVPPSTYRQQISPVVFADTVTLPAQKPSAKAWLEKDNIEEQIDARITSLGGSTLELLKCASLLGDRFDLIELAKVTSNPAARVAIHLWPVEQAGLIEPELQIAPETALETTKENTSSDDLASYAFTHKAIRNVLHERMTDSVIMQWHLLIGQAKFTSLSSPPFSLEQLRPVLFHLNKGAFSSGQLSDSYLIPTDLQALNIMAADLAEQHLDYQSADAFLGFAQRQSAVNDENHKTKLLLQRIRVSLLAGNIEVATQCLQQLPAQMSIEEQISAALMQAQIYQHQGLHAQSLIYLLNNLATLDSPLPDNETEQLSLLLIQLSDINVQFNALPIKDMNEICDQKQLLRLHLLEQISLVARQQSNPLLAACAIGRMTILSLEHGRSSLTAFAFVSYAWVASWFCADYALAQRLAAQGMILAHEYGALAAPQNHESLIQQHEAAISAVLRHSSQVLHWFSPVENAISQLQHVDQVATEQSQWLIQSECRLVQHQLMFFSAIPLSKQLHHCRKDQQQMIDQAQPFQATRLTDSTLILLEYLHEEKPFPGWVQYQHGWQAVSTILGALLLDKQSLWPELCSWEALFENELAGYFCVTEALFCTAMMRLIQAQQQHALSRRRRIEIEHIELRLELWARHCPENFKGQWLLLQAEKARLEEQGTSSENKPQEKPSILFEQALKATEIHAFGFHKALCYERYADYLHDQGQFRLARFCLNEASYLYQQWGASAKVNQLRQSHILLAI